MSTINLVSTLMNHGKSLAKQLDIAKTMFQQNSSKANIKSKPVENNIYDEVEKVVNDLMKDLDVLDDGEYTTKDCFDKVARKTISSLEELKKLDNPCYATRYEALVTMVGKFRLSTDVISTHGTTTSTLAHITNDNDNDNDNDNADIDFNLGFFKGLANEKQFLLYLFAMLPRGTIIKKNDLALWFVSPNEELHPEAKKDDGKESDFEKHVRELVDMKLIKPVLTFAKRVSKNNKREGFKYKIHNVIWSKLQASENDKFDAIRIQKINSLSISITKSIGKSVVNTEACNLTAERLNMLTNHYTAMMQLGNWNHDPRKYIVVEEVDTLIMVLNNSPLEYLSLQGVSGLVILPSLYYNYLKVFILKGCHNLESIPQFNTLRHIEYLDMSECYQLDHSANVVDACIRLRVVKGFVLPRQQDDPRNSFISNPSQFEHLWKLTLRTRRLNFPTNTDLKTLCELQSLTHLKITWVGACSPDNNQEVRFDVASKFPPKLTKFEMEAASDDTSTKILDLIVHQKKTTITTIPKPLKKVYIKGGNLSKLNPEIDCKILRLHYLPKMKFDCYDMMESFPKLHRLEMSKDVMYSMLRRSFQKATGTNDQNSAWEPSLTPPTSPSSAS